MNIKEYVKHREETYFQKYDNIEKYDWDRRDNKIFTCVAECRCCHHKYTVTLRESDTLSDIATKLQKLKDDTKDWYTNEDGNSLCSYCYERFQRDKKRQTKIHNCLWCEYSYIEDDDTLCCILPSHTNENISCKHCCSDWLESENDREPEKAENQRQEYCKRHTGQEIDEKTNTCIDCGKPLPANLHICDKCLFEEYNRRWNSKSQKVRNNFTANRLK